MDQITEGRGMIVGNEDLLPTLRPVVVAAGGFQTVRAIALAAAGQRPYTEEEDPTRCYYRTIADIAALLDGHRNGDAIENQVLPLPMPAGVVVESRMLRHLFHVAIREEFASAEVKESLTLCRWLAEGLIDKLWLTVEEVERKRIDAPVEAVVLEAQGGLGNGGEEISTPTPPPPEPAVELVRRIVGMRTVPLPAGATVLLTDATASRDDLESVTGRTITDLTPPGVIKPVHRVLQVLKDIKIKTPLRVAADVLRGLLHDLPYREVGVLTHSPLVEELPDLLGEPYAGRVKHWAHFHGSEARGSNVWIEGGCDCLIVLGTPRLPVLPIREHLMRVNKLTAATLSAVAAGWSWDWWSGVTESGRRVTVRTKHYSDHAWHASYHATVTSVLRQAVGRGRPILPEGMPVYVVTTECLCADPRSIDGRHAEARIADAPFAPLTETGAAVLAALRNEQGYRVCRKSPEIEAVLRARGIEVSQQRVRQVLAELRAAGRVRKVGERGGWVI
jgi:hypothetical protein